MQHVDTLIKAGWIVTVDDDFRVLENHALAIDQGRIVAITDQSDRFSAHHVHELPGHVLMPGLVNAHGHAAMSLLRGLSDDVPLMTWLNDHIWPAEQRHVDARFVADGSLLAMAEMILSGTTTFSDMYFFPETVADIAERTGMRCQLSFPVFNVASNWGNNADDYLAKGLALIDKYRAHPLIRIAFGPHAPYTVSDEVLLRVAALAEQHCVPIQMHLHETADEVHSAVQQSGQRPLQRIASLGLLGPHFQAVHMVHLNDDDIALVADSGSHIIHCPESNLKLASGFCQLKRCLDAGINVALGTDGPASNSDLDLFGEMRSAALLAKAVANDASAVDARQAIRMATINGARALGIEAMTGSLETGKAADIIAIDCSGLGHQPLHQPLSQLVYTHVSHKVSHSWVAGRPLLDNYRLTTIDSDACLAAARHWHGKLASPNP
ncbi:MAG TPA: TRZ/ATZ family hydrolase [Pseudomonadales bacterium]